MSGAKRIRDHWKIPAGIACGAILLAGLAAGSHWHRFAKAAGPFPVETAASLSARAAQPSFTVARAPAPPALSSVHSTELTHASESAVSAMPPAAAPLSALSSVSRSQALKTYAALPMMFEANNGQTDPRVKFLARAPGYTLFLTDKEAVLSLPAGASAGTSAPPGKHSRKPSFPSLDTPRPALVVRLKFAGTSTPAVITGRDQLSGKSNYFIGNDPKQWHTSVPNYAAVQYHGIYSGVDAVFHGDNQRLEFDFDLAPGTDPRAIALQVDGAQHLRLNRQGDLLVRMDAKRDVVMGRPRVYQQTAEGRHEIAAHYVLSARNRVAFALGPYDHSQPLVIDPTLAYSTYLGGSVEDSPYAIAADSSGSAYITGVSYSLNFPVTNGAYQTSCTETGNTNCSPGAAFVTKLSPDGSSLVYSTFLNGHTGGDLGTSIAVDSSGAAYILGVERGELDFPTTTGAIQAACNIAANPMPEVFVAKLDLTGSSLVYSTCLQNPEVNASNGFSQGSSFPGGIAVDADGNAYVTGSTDLPQSFPATQTSFQTTCQSNGAEGCAVSEDPFVVKINPTGTTLIYSTFLSGGAISSEVISNGIAVDSLGNAYVIGYDSDVGAYPSGSPGGLLTTLGTIVSSCPNFSCGGFLAKINGNATVLAYSTYLANVSNYVTPTAVAVDQNGNAYVTGYTGSTDFPSTQGVLQYYFTPLGSTTTNLEDGFVIKMDQLGDAYAYATLLGGTASNTIATGIAVDAAGHAFVTGTTDTGYPTTVGAFQTTDQAGANQVFFSELDPIGASLLYSTFLAGTTGQAYDTEPAATGVSYLATDPSGNAYVTGQTNSTNFPTTPEAFQTNSPLANGGQSQSVTGFVAKFTFALVTPFSISPTALPSGTAGVLYPPVTFSTTGGQGMVTISETGGLPAGMSFSNGELSGTPIQTGSYPITIAATDSQGDAASEPITLVINCPAIAVTPTSLAPGTSGTAYPSVTFAETGGVGSITFSETGALPTGMTFVAGVLSGTPTQTGSFPVMVTATDSNGCAGSVSDTLTINSSTGAGSTATTTAIGSTSASFDGFSLPTNFALVGTTQVTVSFTVKPVSGSALPTGTVIVTDGFGDTCSATLSSASAGAGSCALTISQVGSGSASLTASYTPDSSASSSGLLASSSSAVTENVVQIVFCGGVPAPTTVSEGATTSITFTVCLAGDVNAVPTAVTSNCLTDATCTLTVTAVAGKTGAYTVTLSIATNAGSFIVRNPHPQSGPWPVVLFALSTLLFLGMAFLLSRSRRGRLRLVYAAGLVLALAIAGVSGCSSASMSSPPNNGGTPLGAFTIKVNVTAGNFSVIVPVSVTVTK